MIILKGIYNFFKNLVLMVLNPFDTFTLSKGTKGTSEFMGKNFWAIILISIIITCLVVFIGYYDEFFKGLFEL